MGPDLGAMDGGAELTRHGALDQGAELTRHGALDQGAEMVQFLASVCERGVRRGQGVGALICGADPRCPDPRRRGDFHNPTPIPSRTLLGFSLPPVPPLLRRHISNPKILTIKTSI
jgi:hypothetical protein